MAGRKKLRTFFRAKKIFFFFKKKKMKRKILEDTTIYHGTMTCQGIVKKDGSACTYKAYYRQGKQILCGVHSTKNNRKELPKDPEAQSKKTKVNDDHQESVKRHARLRQEKGEKGSIICQKMKRMKNPTLIEGVMNVFPNNRHQNREDGFGCCSLSPMRLGPVLHQQKTLPPAKNIENYHQFNKVFPPEYDTKEDKVLDIFYKRQKEAYEDETPHRHKFSSQELKQMVADRLITHKNAPLFSIHQDKYGKEHRFSYVQSRYFYCCAYEKLAKKSPDFAKLLTFVNDGYAIAICGFDAYPVTHDVYTHYCDDTRPFGHELVLYSLLTIKDPVDYPWHVYRSKHEETYQDIPADLAK
jgi:hypothetical protein